MKKLIKIILILIVPISIIVISGMFYLYKTTSHEPVYFDLFISQYFFGNENESSWDEVPEYQKRPIEWLINKEQFEVLDSIYLGFKNTSNEKMYYMTWGKPNSRIRINYLVYKNGEVNRIPFGGFGCSTGIYLEPLKNGAIAGSKFLNPLMFNPHTNYHLPIKDKVFPKLFKEIYGDSITINFEQVTHNLVWSIYPSQIIKSSSITVSTERILEKWKNTVYEIDPQFDEKIKMSYYFKENGDLKVSTLYINNEKNKHSTKN